MRNSFLGLCIALVIALLIGCAHPHRHHHVKKTGKTICSCRMDTRTSRTGREMDTGTLE